MKRIRSLGPDLFAVLLVLAGICLLLYPDVQEWKMQWESESAVRTFQEAFLESGSIQETGTEEKRQEIEESQKKTENESSAFYREIETYNKRIFQEKQEGFCDAWSYEQSPVSLDGLKEGIFGYVTISSMNRTFPLYVGASMENLAKGLAVLGQTSIPIGGENTNSVISGHRGWSTGPFLRDIEKVLVGDVITVTNPWEQLTYQVEKIEVINPYDVDALLIQEGRDMLSIVTCHPYLSHGKKDRYVVYAIRKEQEDNDTETGKEEATEIENDAAEENRQLETILDREGVPYPSSEVLIGFENGVRRGIALIAVLLLVSFIYRQHKKGKENRP